MNHDCKRLGAILKAAQMGQLGIRSILEKAEAPLRDALISQLQEYDRIERRAQTLARQKGWTIRDLPPVIRYMTGMHARMQLCTGRTQSRIAGMTIQGNTRGMILSTRDRNRSRTEDPEIQALSGLLLDLEQENIRQMQCFL